MGILESLKSFFGFSSISKAKEAVVEAVEENLTSFVEEEASNAEDGLQSLTVAQLREKAKSLGMKGYTTLRKSELIEAVRENLWKIYFYY